MPETVDVHNLQQVLGFLYKNELNFRIESFWDDGYTVYLGDELNGYKDETHTETLEDAAEFLYAMSLCYYPKLMK